MVIPSSRYGMNNLAPFRWASSISSTAFRRSGPLISLPRRPPRSPALFFSVPAAPPFPPAPFLSSTAPFHKGLAPFLLAPDLFLQFLAFPEFPLIRLKARFLPFFYFRREDTFAAAVLPELGFVERVGLQNDQELVLGAPPFGLLSVSGRGFASASHFFLPFRQGHVGDSALLRQIHDVNISHSARELAPGCCAIRRHHLPDNGFLEFRALSFHLHHTSGVHLQYTLNHSDQATSIMTPGATLSSILPEKRLRQNRNSCSQRP